MLATINTAIAPRWVAANTAGGGADSDAVIRNTPASVEEFALRPLASTNSQFEDEAALIARRLALQTPSPYLVLDSLPTGGSPTDPRTQLATLAYYYLVADPDNTFLMLYGGFDPNSAWTQHWTPAAAYDVGLPTTAFSLLPKEPTQPTRRSLTRSTNATTATRWSCTNPLLQTRRRHRNLDERHRHHPSTQRHVPPPECRRTLSGPVTTVTLRNGEGAILIKA